jgi:hypothetical protein
MTTGVAVSVGGGCGVAVLVAVAVGVGEGSATSSVGAEVAGEVAVPPAAGGVKVDGVVAVGAAVVATGKTAIAVGVSVAVGCGVSCKAKNTAAMTVITITIKVPAPMIRRWMGEDVPFSFGSIDTVDHLIS